MPFDLLAERPATDACFGGQQLSFDFDAGTDDRGSGRQAKKSARHRANYFAGLSAENTVLNAYRKQGARLLETRWRGPGGEIDLIVGEGDRVVFVEVKKSKTHARAAQRVSDRQMARIMASAEAYLGCCPKGALTEMRIDVALVDAQGAVDIVPNASMAA